MLLLASVTGLLFGYWICGMITSRSAVWVWIPVVLAFGVRVIFWLSTGSVLFHASVIEHFITADCQAQSWREMSFVTSCTDKVLLTPLIFGALAYSAGAAVQRFAALRRHSKAIPT